MAGKKTPSAKKKAPGKKKAPVRVIVEFRVSRADGPAAAFDAGAESFDAAGFAPDQGWDPVSVGASADMAMELEAAREETVLVRGTVDPGQKNTLKRQAGVVDVWDDTPIAPFASRSGEEGMDIVQPVANAAFGPCPIPPCDCSPGVAKGDIAAVRAYLGVDQIHADGVQGQGIVVGVVDGGITTPSRVSGGKIPNVIGGLKSDWGQKAFWGGHGEMSATDVLGMAPQARLYDLRLVDSATDSLGALISDAIAGYQWAIGMHQANGTPHILTNSWGIYQKAWDPVYATNPNHPFTRKVVDALNEGILVLFAAGNCGGTCPDGRCGGDNGPGKSIWGANGHPDVMTVGAANKNEEFIGYSSEGPAALSQQKPDFCSISHFKGYFSSDNGTSAACPVAAGVVALLKQKKSDLTQAVAKDLLKSTAKNIGPAGWDQHSGSGIIQAKKAYDKMVGVRVVPCMTERTKALDALRRYRTTGNRQDLCTYYRYLALYYRCLYLKTRNGRYLCMFYAYAARYYLCMFQLTRQRRYDTYYRRYWDAYRRCR